MRKKVLVHGIAFLLFSAAGIFITYPLLFHLGDYTTGFADELNYTWMFNWVIHVILSGNIFSLYNTNIFYPYNIALSDSDPNLITAALTVIPYLLIKEPIVVVNFTLISSLIFLGFSVYALSFYLTKDFWASLLSGVLVIFSPAVLSFYVHLQMLAIAWVLFALLFFIIFLTEQKIKYLVISLLFFLIQTYNNFLAGYFILFSYVIIFCFRWFEDKKKIKKLITKKHVFLFVVSFLLLIPIMFPYYKVSKEFHYVRDIRDSIHFAIQPEDFLYSSSFSRLENYLNTLPFNRVSQNNEFKPGYLGIVFSLLVLVALVYGFKHFKQKKSFLPPFLTMAITGLILSLGPVLHLGRQTVHEPFLIPLPYALFYYIVPGFQGFRNSARWEMLFIVAMAVVIAMMLSRLLRHVLAGKKIALYSLLFIGIFAEFNFPMHFKPVTHVRDFPKVHKWLATTSKEITYIEMPVYNWNMFRYANTEFMRMYYSTIHFRRTVNGGGGFTPPPWEKMAYELDATFPSEEAVNRLKEMGVMYIIVHKKEFDMLNKDGFKPNNQLVSKGDTVISELAKNKKVKLIKRFGDDYVYRFK